MTEGIIWTKKDNGEWTMTANWPAGRRNARIIIDDEAAFGNYSLSEATRIITQAIEKNQTKDHYKYTIIPGKEMTSEAKEKLVEFTKKKKQERGEEPVESYISNKEE